LLRCLDQLNVSKVPLLILTHFHARHVDGLSGVLAHRIVAEISPLASPAYEAAVQQLAAEHGIPERTPPVGGQGAVGTASLVVIRPSASGTSSTVDHPDSG
jgi:competence protein ComEC